MSDESEILGARPHFGDMDGILEDIRSVLESGQLTQAAHQVEFEKEFAASVGCEYALAVNSGGTALELALRALDIRGREVIVPTDTFVASGSAVVQAGGRVVFADIRRDTLCLDPSDVARRLTDETAGIMYVHMFGRVPPDFAEIKGLCAERGLFLLEDAAHAKGSSLAGVAAGNLGDVGCFSFYATKVMTTGEGGMVTTRRRDVYETVRSLRNHGCSPNKPVYDKVSNNYRMSEIQAVLGRHQLRELPEAVDRRRAIASRYRESLAGVDGVELLPDSGDGQHSQWRFPLYLADGIDRGALQTRLWERHRVRITWMYEPLCHLQPLFKGEGYGLGDLPVAEACMQRLVCLPTHGHLSDADVERVCTALTKEIAARDA